METSPSNKELLPDVGASGTGIRDHRMETWTMKWKLGYGVCKDWMLGPIPLHEVLHKYVVLQAYTDDEAITVRGAPKTLSLFSVSRMQAQQHPPKEPKRLIVAAPMKKKSGILADELPKLWFPSGVTLPRSYPNK